MGNERVEWNGIKGPLNGIKGSTTELEASCSTPFMVAVMYVLRAMN